jgi:hypothetical protein
MNLQAERMYGWLSMMVGSYFTLSDAKREELEAWERIHVAGDGVCGTSDWPGWAEYLPPKPVADPRPAPKVKANIPASLRRAVFERDGYRCRRCGGWRGLQTDHVVAESRGGPTSLQNLQTLCQRCNRHKGVS